MILCPMLWLSTSAFVVAKWPISAEAASFTQPESLETDGDDLLFAVDDIFMEQDAPTTRPDWDDTLFAPQSPAAQTVAAAASSVLAAHPDLASHPSALGQALLAALPGGTRVVVRRTQPPSAGRSAKEDPTLNLRNLRHEFLMIDLPGGANDAPLIVDARFGPQFALSRTSPAYAAAAAALPDLMVAGAVQLQGAVAAVVARGGQEYAKLGEPLPPWRTLPAQLSKWLAKDFVDTPLWGGAEEGRMRLPAGPTSTPAPSSSDGQESDSEAPSFSSASSYSSPSSSSSSARSSETGSESGSEFGVSPVSVLGGPGALPLLFGGVSMSSISHAPATKVVGFTPKEAEGVKRSEEGGKHGGGGAAVGGQGQGLRAALAQAGVGVAPAAPAAQPRSWEGLLPRVHVVRRVHAV